MAVTAIVPARGGSKGIPRKNLRMLGDHPLVAHAIRQAQAAAAIDRVVVSTEDDEIAEVARRYGAEVRGRIDEFTQDNSVQEVDRLLRWTVLQMEDDGDEIGVVVLLYPTAPFRRVETIDAAVRLVTEQGFDCSLSLVEDTSYLWKLDGSTAAPVNYDPATRGPRQMEEWNQWIENKAVYAVRRDLLVETGCRLGGRIGYVEMDKLRSIDVDKPEDLTICEALRSSGIVTIEPGA